MFSKRLKELNKDVHLDILSGLPHGFLNFCLVSTEVGVFVTSHGFRFRFPKKPLKVRSFA
jgi:hypothetical protein